MRKSAWWTGSCHLDEKELNLAVYRPHPTVAKRISISSDTPWCRR